MQKQQATILTPKEAGQVPLPKSMKEAAGLLVKKRKALERHINQLRKEWERSGGR